MKKRTVIFCILMAIVFSFSLKNIAFATDDPEPLDSFTDANYTIELNSDGTNTCTIVSYNATTYTNMIPSTINGYTVTRIADGAFKGLKYISGKVTIPDTVISIGDEAFSGCTYITQITLGSSTVSIGDYAFYGCTELTSITLSNVKSIGQSAFEGCNAFSSDYYLTMPKSVTYVGSNAFCSCTIGTIEFVSTVAPEVETDTFNGFTGTVIIPYTLTEYIGTAWSGAKVSGVKVMGDLDHDNDVDAVDAALALDIYKYGGETDEDLIYGDMNRDGKIDAVDAALILDAYKYGN